MDLFLTKVPTLARLLDKDRHVIIAKMNMTYYLTEKKAWVTIT